MPGLATHWDKVGAGQEVSDRKTHEKEPLGLMTSAGQAGCLDDGMPGVNQAAVNA